MISAQTVLGRELYTRLVFNVFVGNNDDHLRNHAAFWDGARLQLPPPTTLVRSPAQPQLAGAAPVAADPDGLGRHGPHAPRRSSAAPRLPAPGAPAYERVASSTAYSRVP